MVSLLAILLACTGSESYLIHEGLPEADLERLQQSAQSGIRSALGRTQPVDLDVLLNEVQGETNRKYGSDGQPGIFRIETGALAESWCDWVSEGRRCVHLARTWSVGRTETGVSEEMTCHYVLESRRYRLGVINSRHPRLMHKARIEISPVNCESSRTGPFAEDGSTLRAPELTQTMSNWGG
jgi:hypothetical protein